MRLKEKRRVICKGLERRKGIGNYVIILLSQKRKVKIIIVMCNIFLEKIIRTYKIDFI